MRVLVVNAHPNPHSFNHELLDQFVKGLKDGGHKYDVINLYETYFNPVYNLQDYTKPSGDIALDDVLEGMNLKQVIIDLSGGPVKKFFMKRWLKNKKMSDVIASISKHRHKDVLRHQEKVAEAEGLVFISPVYWMSFPAILKGWVERVFTYGFSYSLTHDGLQGDVKHKVPLLKHKKALIINTTYFKEEDFKAGMESAIEIMIHDFGFRYPGNLDVEHICFYRALGVDGETRQEYLEKAYNLGLEF